MDRRIILILLLMPTVASAGLFDIFDEQYIENINELPVSVDIVPDKNWQPSMEYVEERCLREYSPYFISSWIDLVGFERIVMVNGVQYLNESPSTAAIVRYDSIACTLGRPRYKGGWIHTLDSYQSGNMFVERLTATAVLYYYYGDRKYYDNITGYYTDAEPIPQKYSVSFRPIVNITEYDNPLEQKIVVHVSEPSASKISVRYGDMSFLKTQNAYHVEKNAKGIYFANSTSLEAWEVKGEGIARMGDAVVINTNVTTMNYSELNITVSDIFGSFRVNPAQFNITRISYEPEKIVYNPLLFGFVGIIGIMFSSSMFIIWRII